MKETHISCGEGNMGAFLKLWRKGKGGDGLLSAERSISISLVRTLYSQVESIQCSEIRKNLPRLLRELQGIECGWTKVCGQVE